MSWTVAGVVYHNELWAEYISHTLHSPVVLSYFQFHYLPRFVRCFALALHMTPKLRPSQVRWVMQSLLVAMTTVAKSQNWALVQNFNEVQQITSEEEEESGKLQHCVGAGIKITVRTQELHTNTQTHMHTHAFLPLYSGYHREKAFSSAGWTKRSLFAAA